MGNNGGVNRMEEKRRKKRGKRKEKKRREEKGGVRCRAGNEPSYLGSARARLEKSSARAQLVS